MNIKILSLLILLFSFYKSFSYDNLGNIQNQNDDTTNLYYKGLILHLKYVENLSSNLPNNKPFKIYVQAVSGITDVLPKRIGNFEVVYLSQPEITSRVRAGKSIYLIVLTPIVIENNVIKLTIIDATVSFKKKGLLNYGNGGGSSIKYNYNCESGNYEVAELIQGGR